ncbi:MAG: hypothetical protein AB7P37_20565 [Ramlibacter sp.]
MIRRFMLRLIFRTFVLVVALILPLITLWLYLSGELTQGYWRSLFEGYEEWWPAFKRGGA